MKAISLLYPLAAAAYVAAHGFVTDVTIDGTSYTGNIPNSKVQASIIRLVSSGDPVKGALNPSVNCGNNAQLASSVGTANPGSTISFAWKGEDGVSLWPHNTGPMLTYMTSCGSTDCSSFNSSNAEWFKIQEVGRKSPGGDWAQADLMTGSVATITLPATLAAGNYVIRHEIIALHLATEMGGAEFYPSCSQITVGGSETGGPTTDELVKLPGAYSDSDPGIFDPNVYDTSAPYTFPGPPIAAFVNGTSSSSGSGSGSGAPASTPTKTKSTASPTGTAPASTGQSTSSSCRLKRRTTPATTNDLVVRRPRHISRVMRDLIGLGRSGHS